VLPRIREPMAATSIAKPFHRPGCVYKEKVDGWRVLAYKDAAGVRLASRNSKDLTRRFPELAAAVVSMTVETADEDIDDAAVERAIRDMVGEQNWQVVSLLVVNA